MAFAVSFNLDEGLLGEAIDGVREQLGDLTELMTILAGRAIKLIDRKFQLGGPGWQPLAERTLQRRADRGKDAKMLLDTGTMRKSLIARGQGDSAIWEISADGFQIGTTLVYAATHQFGRGNIPARPYIPTEEELAAELIPVVERYLADKLGQ